MLYFTLTMVTNNGYSTVLPLSNHVSQLWVKIVLMKDVLFVGNKRYCIVHTCVKAERFG